MFNRAIVVMLLGWHALIHYCDFWQLPGPLEYDFLLRLDGSRSPALITSLQPLERVFIGLIGALYGIITLSFAAAFVGAVPARYAATVCILVHGLFLVNLFYLRDQWTQVFFPGSFPVSYVAFIVLQVGPMLLSLPLLISTPVKPKRG
jgi:hypothetical protein